MSKKVNRKIPKLRFSEFEESWDLKKLRSISSLSSGATPLRSNSSYFENATIPWVKTTDLNNSEILKTEECISDIAIRETSARKNPVGSVLIAMYGGFNQIGRTGLLKIEAATNQAITVVLPKSGIDSYFLLHFLNRNVDQWRSFAASSRKDPNITSKDVGDFPIAFPSIAEQEKIASFFGAVDTRISQLRRKHELLQTYKRGVMQKIFSQQIRFKGDDGKLFPEWKKRKIGEVFDVTRGQVLAMPETSREKNSQMPYPVYSSQTKENGLAGYYSEYLFEDAITWTTDGANAGDTKYRRGKFYCTNVCGVLLSDEGFANTFTAELINSVSQHYVSYVGNPKLMNNVMSLIHLDFPCLQEQEKIADFLTAIDQKIEAVAQQIKLTEQFKKGLLQKMFV